MRGPANVIDYQQSQTPSPSSSSLNPISFIQNLNQSYSAMERLGLIQSVVQSELKTRRDFSHVRVTPDQFDHFITNGYLVLPSCVDENVVNSALKLINLQLGKGVSSEKVWS